MRHKIDSCTITNGRSATCWSGTSRPPCIAAPAIPPRASGAFGAVHLGGHDKAFHVVETDEEDDDGFDLRSLAEGGGSR